LLVCSWPTKCQVRGRSAHAAAFGAASWSGQQSHVGGGPGLGDRDQRQVSRVTPGRGAGGVDPGPHLRQIRGQLRAAAGSRVRVIRETHEIT
jgi:hypothetical protein